MLFAVPDQLVCGPAGIDPAQLAGCNPTAAPPSTSYRNQFYGNIMGRSRRRDRAAERDRRRPTGRTDFWWDQYVGQHRQLLARQHGQGRHAVERHEHAAAPLLPSKCDGTSVGTGGPAAGGGAAQLLRRHHVRHRTRARGSRRRRNRNSRDGPAARRAPRRRGGGRRPAALRDRAAGRLSADRAARPRRRSVPASADVGESARSDTCAQWQAGTVTQRYGALARLQEVRGEPGRILERC